MKKVLPSHTIDLEKQIFCFELSGYEWSQNLVCIAVQTKIILGVVRFPEDSENEQFDWVPLEEIHHEPRCTSIAFAPETSLAVIPKVVKLGTAGVDFKIRIFHSNLDSKPTVQILQGHSNYINAIAWDPEGRYLSSVSDDNSCIIWTNNDEQCSEHSIFPLKSAGMSVKWHPDDSEKILVAEKKGVIHMYNVASQQVVLSVETAKSPLMSADWSTANRLQISALVGGDITFWDLRNSCRILETKSIHEDGGLCVRFSSNNENVTASVGRPDITLKVMHLQSQIPQIEAPIKLFGGLCWHYRLPYVGVATDRKLCFWKPMMSVRLDKCKSYCNPKYCNITTICRPLNRTSKFVYMDISLHPGVKFDAPIYVHVMTLKQFATVYRPTMINVKTEVCKELALRTHPLMFGLWKDKTNSGNLLDPCPMEGHRHTKARITNVYDFVSPLLPLLPIGQWRFDTILSTEINGLETVVVSWNDYYEIKPLTAEQF